MDEKTYSFRSSLHGFHRGDVITFLGELTQKHTAELQALRDELRNTREELCAAREEVAFLQQENHALAKLEKASDASADLFAQEENPLREQELAAYRRAERYEREARERAEKIRSDAAKIISETEKQLTAHNAQLHDVSDVLFNHIAQLRVAVAEIYAQLAVSREQIRSLETQKIEENGEL